MAAGDIARWTGAAADGNWGTAGNWTAESGSPSTPPASDEIALFDHRSGANSDVTAGLSPSSIDLQGIIVRKGFSGTIGGAGGGLDLDVSNTSTVSDPAVVWASDRGTLYIGAAGETIDKLCALGAGRVVITGGTVTELIADRGSNVSAVNGVALGTVYNKGGAVIDEGGSSGTTIVASGGRTVSKRSWTTITNDGANTELTNGAYTITTLNTYGSGTHKHDSSGTITTYNGVKGKIVGGDYDFTITTYNKYTGSSSVVQAPGGGNVTVTNQEYIGDADDTL